MKFLPKLAIAVILALATLCAIQAVSAHALDRYQAADKFNALSYSDCGNGTTWVCVVRYQSSCTWISHNYFLCSRVWLETQVGIRNQTQEARGHLEPYYPVSGAWYSPDYYVHNL